MANYDITRFRRGKNQNLTPQDTLSQGSARELSPAGAGARGTRKRPLRRSGIASIVVMTLAGGLVATVAVPAYAFTPGSPETQATASTEFTRTSAQAVEVPTQATTISVARDGFTATTTAQLVAAKAARVATAAAAARTARTVANSTPASSAVAISQPKTFMVNSVFAVAARYQGVPYVFGGASPGGFDCSGLVKYAWAKFGKNLPHSSNAQAAMGHRISRAAARPGDLVVMPGHIGFYAGNGRILHAPYAGQRVRIQVIWTTGYYIVRL